MIRKAINWFLCRIGRHSFLVARYLFRGGILVICSRPECHKQWIACTDRLSPVFGMLFNYDKKMENFAHMIHRLERSGDDE
jgi:hypothetical protein